MEGPIRKAKFFYFLPFAFYLLPFFSLWTLGGCGAGMRAEPGREEVQKQEELGSRVEDQKAAEKGPPSELEGRFNEAVREESTLGKASVARADNELSIYLSDELVFSRENVIEMTPQGEQVLERIGAILRDLPAVPIELEAAAAFKPYGKPEETITRLNQQLHLQLVKLAEHLEQRIGLRPGRIRLQGETPAEKPTEEQMRVRIVLIPSVE